MFSGSLRDYRSRLLLHNSKHSFSENLGIAFDCQDLWDGRRGGSHRHRAFCLVGSCLLSSFSQNYFLRTYNVRFTGLGAGDEAQISSVVPALMVPPV